MEARTRRAWVRSGATASSAERRSAHRAARPRTARVVPTARASARRLTVKDAQPFAHVIEDDPYRTRSSLVEPLAATERPGLRFPCVSVEDGPVSVKVSLP